MEIPTKQPNKEPIITFGIFIDGGGDRTNPATIPEKLPKNTIPAPCIPAILSCLDCSPM